MYSHSSYSDVWGCFFSQAAKYLSDYRMMLFSDDDLGKTPEGWEFIKYNDSDSYTERVSKCLEKVETDLCFFHHEDMFLYESPDYSLMEQYENIVMKDDVDFIRLLRATDTPDNPYSKTLFQIPKDSQYYFSVQPCICKTQSLLKIYKDTHVSHIREFEIKVQDTCKKLNCNGLFHYGGETKRGLHHYDSDAYPYVATAIVKGKWNISDYGTELGEILLENNVNISIRGIV